MRDSSIDLAMGSSSSTIPVPTHNESSRSRAATQRAEDEKDPFELEPAGPRNYALAEGKNSSGRNSPTEEVDEMPGALAPSIPGSENLKPPPDGGWAAWAICFAGHLVIMNTWGFIVSFGVFQPYYAEMLDAPPSDISWIGSLQVFLIFFGGTITGRLTDAGYCRSTILTGTVLTVFGTFMVSIGSQYWHLLLAQGVCMGLGSACLFTPAISVISTYFEKKTSIAIGLAASGSVTGGLVFPSMARQLLPRIGFGWCMRAIAFVQLGTLIVSNILIKPRVPARKKGPMVEWAAFKELDYTFFAIGMFFNFWGLYFAFYYLPAFSRSHLTPNMSYEDSLNLLLVVNGIGIIGRLGPNYFADYVGPLTMLAPACLLCGVTVLAWIPVDTPPKLYAWSAFYGIFAGAIQNLFPAAASSLTADPRKRGTRIGMVFTIVSFAALTGSPIAGAIITAMDGSYLGAQCFAGVDFMIGMTFILLTMVVRSRKKA
ncbi:riboflavin transporter MCH5 [Dactylonectria macrodidyma]|uniref:Riboflavin transporter MCH5 n=1 Tax=Dactylonectria macrodidyma TaxID=307937 RepID=A0A9P9INY3_9HYPO|nr:riboflavin transporter MCH5 [Dactylonectria macrodidyma]